MDNATKQFLNTLISGLVDLATIDRAALGVKVGGLSLAAQNTLGKALGVMPARDFVDAIEFMLGSDSTIVCYVFYLLRTYLPFWQIHVGALELLSERIPKITDGVRQEITATINSIVTSTIKLLAWENVELRTHCLRALKSIASTLAPKEEGVLTAALPSILATLNVPDLVPYALDTLTPLSYVRKLLRRDCF